MPDVATRAPATGAGAPDFETGANAFEALARILYETIERLDPGGVGVAQ
jgi:hypothetical protein